MRNNKGLRSIVGIVARICLVVFGCIALFSGWMLTLSFRAESLSSSPLNPVGVVVFVIVLAIAVTVVLWALLTLVRENRAAEKQKNSE